MSSVTGPGDVAVRTATLLTELARRLAVPPPHPTPESAARIAQMHRVVAQHLEPQLSNAVGALDELERLESDSAVFAAKGDSRRCREVASVIDRLMHTVEQEFVAFAGVALAGGGTAASVSAGSAPPKERRPASVQHDRGFCSAVSPRGKAAPRCLPTRTRTPERPTLLGGTCGNGTPGRVCLTRTGLVSTPPASSCVRTLTPTSASATDRSRRRRAGGGRTPPANAAARTPSPVRGGVDGGRAAPLLFATPASLSPVRPRGAPSAAALLGSFAATPVSPQAAGTPGGGVPASSPRRDREFVHALLRSLQLEEYSNLFSHMSLLAFYRLTPEQLGVMGLPEAAQRTLYGSIDQIRQIADSQVVNSPGRAAPARSSLVDSAFSCVIVASTRAVSTRCVVVVVVVIL